jgi:uncharacterized membrane protein
MTIPVLDKIKANILNPFIAFLMVLALVYFLYGVFQFIAGYDSPAAKEAGKQHMIWGVVGMAIMISVYGLLSLIRLTIMGVAN